MSTMMYTLTILWPDFVGYDGLLLRDATGKSPEDWNAYLQQFRALNWTNAQIEYVINHIHLSQDRFMADPGWSKIDNTVWLPLAYTVADMWRCRLKGLFPDRRCVVRVGEKELEIYAQTERNEHV